MLEGDTELDSCHSVAAEQGQVLWLFMGVRVRMLRAACAAGRAWGVMGAERESKSGICMRSFPGLGFSL